MKSRGRDDCGLTLSTNLDAGRARELQTIRPASHTTALGELFIADEWAGVQEGNLGDVMFTSLVRATRRAKGASVAAPGLVRVRGTDPRLAPWAAFFRRFAAGSSGQLLRS